MAAAEEADLSGHEHNYDDVRGEGFFGQTRRERRAYPSGVCEERATKSGLKRTAARRVAPNLACGGVARRSQITFWICSLLAPCPRPNSARRTSPQVCSIQLRHQPDALSWRSLP